VYVEKENLNSDDVIDALCAATGRARREVGYAGRKDRVAVARQWFSVQLAQEPDLARVTAPPGSRLAILRAARHRNKLRLGHLRGNHFRLGLEVSASERPELARALERLTLFGVDNRFGAQRFGAGGANLAVARAWASGDPARAAALCVDPTGGWQPGDSLPEGFRPGLFGKVLGGLRRDPAKFERALRGAGPPLRQLLASAAQSAVFNAVLDARRERGLTHVARAGDVLRRRDGGLFRCRPDEQGDASRRAAPGVQELLVTGPLPGDDCYAPSPEVEREEREWSKPAEIDWAWFQGSGPLVSPGARRELVVPFVAPPRLELEDRVAWLELTLPPGTYATEVLSQLGVTVPERRAQE
jgi:tRNA pseudouridine13 synthase